MPVKFYMDVHIPEAATEQLLLKGVDVFAATKERTNRLSDKDLLILATSLKRVVVTHDIRFRVMAEAWQRQGQKFAGLAYAHADIRVGRLINELEIIAKASEPEEWENRVFYILLR